jgi:hypothetical protein
VHSPQRDGSSAVSPRELEDACFSKLRHPPHVIHRDGVQDESDPREHVAPGYGYVGTRIQQAPAHRTANRQEGRAVLVSAAADELHPELSVCRGRRFREEAFLLEIILPLLAWLGARHPQM